MRLLASNQSNVSDMKYAGTVSIVDDEGNEVFTRELTADEMIDELLARKEPTPERPTNETDGRRGRKCSVCGKHGHNVVTCPENERGHPNASKNPTLKGGSLEKTRAPRHCSQCGKEGHMRRFCPGSAGYEETKGSEATINEVQGRNQDRRLTNSEFVKIRERHSQGLPGGDIADEFNCSVDEVRRAVSAPHYMGYINDRVRA